MADIVLVAKFVLSTDKSFQDFIDYIDREQAQKVKTDTEHKTAFSAFTDYMGNEEKTTGVFDNWNDKLSEWQVNKVKNSFEHAQENGGIMWQQVISFTPEFLKENKILHEGAIDEDRLRAAARKAVNVQLKKEQLISNCVWTGAIHYNTDNIHIHIAMVEKEPGRTRGKIKESTLNSAKAAVLNELSPRDKQKEIINEQRNKIIDIAKLNNNLLAISASIKNVQKILPENGRLQYNSANITPEAKKIIDTEIEFLLSTVLKTEYTDYMNSVEAEKAFYKKSYGAGERHLYENYTKTKKDELYSRIGNVLLKTASEISFLEKNSNFSNVRVELKKYEAEIQQFRKRQEIKRELARTIRNIKSELEKQIAETDYALTH